MHSSLIGKIEKAKRYAQEPERVTVMSLNTHFRGDNDAHDVSFDGTAWHCTCEFHQSWQTCQHVMALQRMLGALAPETNSEAVAASA